MKLLSKLILGLFALTFILSSCTKKTDEKDNGIYIPLRAAVKGFDPIHASDVYSSTVIAQVYEGLLHYQYLKRPYEVVPSLAEAMPVITDKGLTYTFKIRKGIKFHDDPAFPGGKGRDLVASDFIYSLRRLADPSTLNDGFWIIDGKIKGLNEWVDFLKNKKADYSTPIEGLQAPDNSTLIIKLTQPYYQLNYVLTLPYTFAVARETVEKYGNEYLNHPVGTGPFMFDSWVRNSKITLKRFPNYHQETYPSEGAPGDREAGLLNDAGKTLPLADKVIFVEMPEDAPRWQNFMKGNFDFGELPPDNYDAMILDKKVRPENVAKGMKLTITSGDEYTYESMNMKDPILGKNKDLRHAMSLSHNAQGVADKFQNGHAIPAQSMLPPDISGYEPNFVNPYQKLDLPQAKKLLAKAGYPEGKGLPEFTYETLSDSKNRQQAEYFQQNMAAIGVKIVINANTWPQFQDKIKNMKAQIFGIAWTADYPDGQDFLQLFYSKNISPGPNDSNFSNAEYDKLYEQSLLLPPGAERDQLYHKMRDIVVEETPQILELHRQFYIINHGWVDNLKFSYMILDYAKYIKIDPKKRAELKAKL